MTSCPSDPAGSGSSPQPRTYHNHIRSTSEADDRQRALDALESTSMSNPRYQADDILPSRKTARPLSMWSYSSSPATTTPQPPTLVGPSSRAFSQKRSSRWAVVIIPPPFMPHSPPPAHVSGFAHGYGASGRYSGGILLPLQATLTLQLAAIARDFSFPSTGGLTLHLSLNDDSLVGAPRITDDTWPVIFGWAFDENPPAYVTHPNGLLASVGLPVAARLEFDIDLRKARWYEAWSNSSHSTSSFIPNSRSTSSAREFKTIQKLQLSNTPRPPPSELGSPPTSNSSSTPGACPVSFELDGRRASGSVPPVKAEGDRSRSASQSHRARHMMGRFSSVDEIHTQVLEEEERETHGTDATDDSSDPESLLHNRPSVLSTDGAVEQDPRVRALQLVSKSSSTALDTSRDLVLPQTVSNRSELAHPAVSDAEDNISKVTKVIEAVRIEPEKVVRPSSCAAREESRIRVDQVEAERVQAEQLAAEKAYHASLLAEKEHDEAEQIEAEKAAQAKFFAEKQHLAQQEHAAFAQNAQDKSDWGRKANYETAEAVATRQAESDADSSSLNRHTDLQKTISSFIPSSSGDLAAKQQSQASNEEVARQLVEKLDRLAQDKMDIVSPALALTSPRPLSPLALKSIPAREGPRNLLPPPTRSKVIMMAKAFGGDEPSRAVSPTRMSHKGRSPSSLSSGRSFDPPAQSMMAPALSEPALTEPFAQSRVASRTLNSSNLALPTSLASDPSGDPLTTQLSSTQAPTALVKAEVSSMAITPGDPSTPLLYSYADHNQLSSDLADFILNAQDEALARHQKFVIALSGGSLPKLMGSGLLNKADVKWGTWKVFFADERIVPLDHSDSNFATSMDALFSKVPIERSQITAIMGIPPDGIDLDELSGDIASTYEAQILDELEPEPDLPRFDLILLGMGDDGHTCSLFPDHRLLDSQAIVTWLNDSPKHPPHRITLSLPVLNLAHNLAFVCTGAGKQKMLADVLERSPSLLKPASLIKLDGRSVSWFVDDDAAAQTRHPRTLYRSRLAPAARTLNTLVPAAGSSTFPRRTLKESGEDASQGPAGDPMDTVKHTRNVSHRDPAVDLTQPLGCSFNTYAVNMGHHYPHNLRIYPSVYPHVADAFYLPMVPNVTSPPKIFKTTLEQGFGRTSSPITGPAKFSDPSNPNLHLDVVSTKLSVSQNISSLAGEHTASGVFKNSSSVKIPSLALSSDGRATAQCSSSSPSIGRGMSGDTHYAFSEADVSLPHAAGVELIRPDVEKVTYRKSLPKLPKATDTLHKADSHPSDLHIHPAIYPNPAYTALLPQINDHVSSASDRSTKANGARPTTTARYPFNLHTYPAVYPNIVSSVYPFPLPQINGPATSIIDRSTKTTGTFQPAACYPFNLHVYPAVYPNIILAIYPSLLPRIHEPVSSINDKSNKSTGTLQMKINEPLTLMSDKLDIQCSSRGNQASSTPSRPVLSHKIHSFKPRSGDTSALRPYYPYGLSSIYSSVYPNLESWLYPPLPGSLCSVNSSGIVYVSHRPPAQYPSISLIVSSNMTFVDTPVVGRWSFEMNYPSNLYQVYPSAYPTITPYPVIVGALVRPETGLIKEQSAHSQTSLTSPTVRVQTETVNKTTIRNLPKHLNMAPSSSKKVVAYQSLSPHEILDPNASFHGKRSPPLLTPSDVTIQQSTLPSSFYATRQTQLNPSIALPPSMPPRQLTNQTKQPAQEGPIGLQMQPSILDSSFYSSEAPSILQHNINKTKKSKVLRSPVSVQQSHLPALYHHHSPAGSLSPSREVASPSMLGFGALGLSIAPQQESIPIEVHGGHESMLGVSFHGAANRVSTLQTVHGFSSIGPSRPSQHCTFSAHPLCSASSRAENSGQFLGGDYEGHDFWSPVSPDRLPSADLMDRLHTQTPMERVIPFISGEAAIQEEEQRRLIDHDETVKAISLAQASLVTPSIAAFHGEAGSVALGFHIQPKQDLSLLPLEETPRGRPPFVTHSTTEMSPSGTIPSSTPNSPSRALMPVDHDIEQFPLAHITEVTLSPISPDRLLSADLMDRLHTHTPTERANPFVSGEAVLQAEEQRRFIENDEMAKVVSLAQASLVTPSIAAFHGEAGFAVLGIKIEAKQDSSLPPLEETTRGRPPVVAVSSVQMSPPGAIPPSMPNSSTRVLMLVDHDIEQFPLAHISEMTSSPVSPDRLPSADLMDRLHTQTPMERVNAFVSGEAVFQEEEQRRFIENDEIVEVISLAQASLVTPSIAAFHGETGSVALGNNSQPKKGSSLPPLEETPGGRPPVVTHSSTQMSPSGMMSPSMPKSPSRLLMPVDDEIEQFPLAHISEVTPSIAEFHRIQFGDRISLEAPPRGVREQGGSKSRALSEKGSVQMAVEPVSPHGLHLADWTNRTMSSSGSPLIEFMDYSSGRIHRVESVQESYAIESDKTVRTISLVDASEITPSIAKFHVKAEDALAMNGVRQVVVDHPTAAQTENPLQLHVEGDVERSSGKMSPKSESDSSVKVHDERAFYSRHYSDAQSDDPSSTSDSPGERSPVYAISTDRLSPLASARRQAITDERHRALLTNRMSLRASPPMSLGLAALLAHSGASEAVIKDSAPLASKESDVEGPSICLGGATDGRQKVLTSEKQEDDQLRQAQKDSIPFSCPKLTSDHGEEGSTLSLVAEDEVPPASSSSGHFQSPQSDSPSPPPPIVFPFIDQEDISEALAQFVYEAQEAAFHRQPRFRIAVSGGFLADILSAGILNDERICWDKWDLFFVDAALAPTHSPASTYHQYHEALLKHVPIAPEHVHTINRLTDSDIQEANNVIDGLDTATDELADDYEQHLLALFLDGNNGIGEAPKFDLILLGVGPDGHVACLFPKHPLLGETDWYVAWLGDAPEAPTHRVTFTLPLLNAAHQLALIAIGKERSAALADALERWKSNAPAEEDDGSNPVALLKTDRRPIVWFVDEAATHDMDYPSSRFWDE